MVTLWVSERLYFNLLLLRSISELFAVGTSMHQWNFDKYCSAYELGYPIHKRQGRQKDQY